MFKIEFSGLSFDNSLFINEKYQEGKPILVQNFENVISDTWNNEVLRVQTIIYTQYKCIFNLRASQLVDFEKIKFAPKIVLIYGSDFWNCKLVNFEIETIANEFSRVTVYLADLGSKIVENVTDSPLYTEQLKYVYGLIGATYNLFVNPIENYDLEFNEVANFKNKINDYNKLSHLKKVRYYCESASLYAFLSKLITVAPNKGYLYLNSNPTEKFYYINFAKEQIGLDLYKIDIDLIYTNPTITKTY
jgi:hypothetical protein